MFYIKYKKIALDLEKELTKKNTQIALQDTQLSLLRKELFELKNPAKFKVGDQIKDVFVIGRTFMPEGYKADNPLFLTLLLCVAAYKCFSKTEPKKWDFIKPYQPYWKYEVVKIGSGKKEFMREDQLCHIFNESRSFKNSGSEKAPVTVKQLIILFQEYQLDLKIPNYNFTHNTVANIFMEKYGINDCTIPELKIDVNK